jgi:hypothetical protein
MGKVWVSLYHIPFFGVKNGYVYIYMFIYIFLNEGILVTIFRGEMQCQNARIKVFDSSLIRMNMFPFECLM